ncbi:MAG: hypothetical protein Q9219_003464 [cf. Caloplaca sp. 3 TL-2023]
MTAKISLLLFLWRVFHVDKKFRVAAWTLSAVLVLWSLVSFLLCIFSCRPLKASWDIRLILNPKTRCNPKSYDVINMHGFCNILTDFGLLCLPIPMLWKLQMTLKKKIGVGAVFATGILRFSVLASLLPSSIRSRFSSHPSAMQQRPTWTARKIPGSNSYTDIEGGAMQNSADLPHSSWQAPRGWHEAEPGRSLDELERASSGGSEMALQPGLATHREIAHKD